MEKSDRENAKEKKKKKEGTKGSNTGVLGAFHRGELMLVPRRKKKRVHAPRRMKFKFATGYPTTRNY